VSFPEPLEPGQRATVGFSLSIELPERNDRFGIHSDLALLGNALPTLAIHDDEGWHLDPYVGLGDSFFSEVARYRVSLDVPAGLATPATGTLVRREDRRDREVRTYVARDVRDFAWAVGPMVAVRGRAGGATVRVWYLPSSMTATGARATLRDAIEAMTTFSSAFGEYPYPSVDVVTAGFVSFGGMEYPRIVFSNPDRVTIAHELAHQWWYAVVGNDEFAEPWLDESLATWSMRLPWFPWRSCDAYDFPSPTARLTNDMAYWGQHEDEFVTVYFGGGCMLADLASRFGLARFTDMLERFAAAHAFDIATTEDFQRLVERVAARHLEGFDAAAYWDTWRVEPPSGP
jgi:aminopeptidase N